MTQSLEFAEQAPTYVYQNVSFRATVKLVDEQGKLTGVRKNLQVFLRFYDTHDVVEERDAALYVTSKAHIDPSTGLAVLTMRLRTFTATCDGRHFCLEVSSTDSTMESVCSAPVVVVKEKLQVTTQPPDVWFKDEGGREKCMIVALTLLPAPGATLEDRVVPLDVRLLYESGNTVVNQGILRLFPDMRPNMTRGHVSISFRIDDVSKNHQGQSFMLEIGPERQDSSSMFQDIAPTRTAVIAVRSKRNKRKLSAQAAALSRGHGSRVSPRSVASSTPCTTTGSTLYRVGGTTGGHELHGGGGGSGGGGGGGIVETHPQRARKYVAASSVAMACGMMHHPLPQSAAALSWSSHLMQHPAAGVVAPMPPLLHDQHTPVHTPASGAGNSPGSVEWSLSGFEMYPDGSMNSARPIYRCLHCRRLNDIDMLAAGPAVSHSPQCVFARDDSDNGNVMYCSEMEGTIMSQQHPMQLHRGYAAHQQMAEQSIRFTAAPQTSSIKTSSYGNSAVVDTAALNMQHNTVNITSKPGDASPKTLAAYATASTERPSMTISPFMNKVATDGMVPGDNEQNEGHTSVSGNLFESNAFHNQMELIGNSSEKPYLGKNVAAEVDPILSRRHEYTGSSFGGVIGTSAFSEMTSMGINLDQYDKGEPQLLGGFGGFGGDGAAEAPCGEDQVFYILARMYTNVHEQKLGLPAFDRFQRMLGLYSESNDDVQTQVVFHPLRDVCLSDEEREEITSQFVDELGCDSQAVHSLPKYQHNLIMLREDALMFYWSQSLV
ncbi:unnamed protein product [Hyaloperonospora brassicae]|uniref:Uncharacterized protein n=1 Tax=Hyaloperonospora brassicae TaxID=162125 RepID=A0AAV0TXS1_HYABA|nr:unnamed protein product [Hyaloperonospora brassicae]